MYGKAWNFSDVIGCCIGIDFAVLMLDVDFFECQISIFARSVTSLMGNLWALHSRTLILSVSGIQPFLCLRIKRVKFVSEHQLRDSCNLPWHHIFTICSYLLVSRLLASVLLLTCQILVDRARLFLITTRPCQRFFFTLKAFGSFQKHGGLSVFLLAYFTDFASRAIGWSNAERVVLCAVRKSEMIIAECPIQSMSSAIAGLMSDSESSSMSILVREKVQIGNGQHFGCSLCEDRLLFNVDRQLIGQATAINQKSRAVPFVVNFQGLPLIWSISEFHFPPAQTLNPEEVVLEILRVDDTF